MLANTENLPFTIPSCKEISSLYGKFGEFSTMFSGYRQSDAYLNDLVYDGHNKVFEYLSYCLTDVKSCELGTSYARPRSIPEFTNQTVIGRYMSETKEFTFILLCPKGHLHKAIKSKLSTYACPYCARELPVKSSFEDALRQLILDLNDQLSVKDIRSNLPKDFQEEVFTKCVNYLYQTRKRMIPELGNAYVSTLCNIDETLSALDDYAEYVLRHDIRDFWTDRKGCDDVRIAHIPTVYPMQLSLFCTQEGYRIAPYQCESLQDFPLLCSHEDFLKWKSCVDLCFPDSVLERNCEISRFDLHKVTYGHIGFLPHRTITDFSYLTESVTHIDADKVTYKRLSPVEHNHLWKESYDNVRGLEYKANRDFPEDTDVLSGSYVGVFYNDIPLWLISIIQPQSDVDPTINLVKVSPKASCSYKMLMPLFQKALSEFLKIQDMTGKRNRKNSKLELLCRTEPNQVSYSVMMAMGFRYYQSQSCRSLFSVRGFPLISYMQMDVSGTASSVILPDIYHKLVRKCPHEDLHKSLMSFSGFVENSLPNAHTWKTCITQNMKDYLTSF